MTTSRATRPSPILRVTPRGSIHEDVPDAIPARLDVSIAGARRARVGPRAPMLRRLGRNPLPRLATKTATLDMFPVCTTTRRSFTRVYTPYSDCFVGATRTFRGRRRRAVRFDRA